MKTPIMHKLSARFIAVAIPLFAVSVFLAGCVVTAVYPYYTERDLVSEPGIIGDWEVAGQTNQANEYIRIGMAAGKTYWGTVFSSTATNSCELHLFRLKQQLFLDSFPTNRSLDFVPVHQISKVIQTGEKLNTANLNYDWLARLLKDNPRAIRHMVLRDKPGDEAGGRIVLTADTRELQRFILAQLNNTNAWNETTVWERRH